MSKFLQLTLLTLFVLFSKEAWGKEKCIQQVEETAQAECSETEYESYVECVRKRTKRGAADCDNSCYGSDCTNNDCDDCDCNYCAYNDCAQECNSCCSQAPAPCASRTCCHQTCNTQCRTSSCRRSCRSKCHQKIDQKPSSSSSHQSSNVENHVKNEDKHNITTIINLHNVINNTNIIDMPINVNNTNINNITIEAPEQQPIKIIHDREPYVIPPGPPVVIPPKEGNCCKIVGPRQCVPTETYPFSKCFHYRKHHCGNLCRQPIMHAEPHEVCDQVSSGKPNCHEQIAYIPQPQPRCSYTSSWPYVSCRIQNNNANCGGCYTHSLKGGQAPPAHCSSSCYDGGYDVGPLYRQGPFYQPSFSAVPPCAYTGNCENSNLFPSVPGYNQMPMNQMPMNQMPMNQMPMNQIPAMNPLENSYQIEPLSSNSIPYGINSIDQEHLNQGNKRETKDDENEEKTESATE